MVSLRAGEILDSPMKFVAPLVYAATLSLATLPILWLSVAFVYLSWLPGVWFYLAPVLMLSLVYGLVDWVLLWGEGLQRPRSSDHIRRCALLYAGLVILGFLFLASAYRDTVNLSPSVTNIAFLCILNAVFIDAAILSLKCWHFSRAHPRSLP